MAGLWKGDGRAGLCRQALNNKLWTQAPGRIKGLHPEAGNGDIVVGLEKQLAWAGACAHAPPLPPLSAQIRVMLMTSCARTREGRSDWRNELPMMLKMLAKGASMISIIGGPFLQFDVFRYPPDLQKMMLGPRWPSTNFCRLEGVLEELRLEKRDPNDADDAGPLGQHHHHWVPFHQFGPEPWV